MYALRQENNTVKEQVFTCYELNVACRVDMEGEVVCLGNLLRVVAIIYGIVNTNSGHY